MAVDLSISPGPVPGVRKVVLSLGAGVQSTVVALMAAEGIIGPMPDLAIFADTGAEPAGVYEHLAWLETKLPFPIVRVSAGNLAEDMMRGGTARSPRFATAPLHILNPDGSRGFGRRQCTKEYKLEPIARGVRAALGLAPGQSVRHFLKLRRAEPVPVLVEQWIGISTDEIQRVKLAADAYVANRWPLLELGMSRDDCLAWFEARYPGRVLAKSACVFCPFKDHEAWFATAQDPESWALAIKVDAAIRSPNNPGLRGLKGVPYVHRTCQPLDRVDVAALAAMQREKRAAAGGRAPPDPDGFDNECEGICGV